MKARRIHRIAAITKVLVENPFKTINLNYFTNTLNCAKSTISEDITIIRESFKKFNMGEIETISGASGGVMYKSLVDAKETRSILQDLAKRLSKPQRILPGGFIFMTDILFSPNLASKIGKIFATRFHTANPDFVVTVETKGIPLALMTANYLNLPLVTIRRNSRVTEGTSVSINYVSGSSKKIQTMSLAKRSLPQGARVVFIDDFLKAGGTVKGMTELMDEFEAKVVGVGVLISTKHPQKKLVEDYTSLLVLNEIDESRGIIDIAPVELG